MNISRFANKESDLDFVGTYIYHPVDRGFVYLLKYVRVQYRESVNAKTTDLLLFVSQEIETFYYL